VTTVLQFKIIQTITERTAENAILHRRVRGLNKSHRFIATLNSRWKQLETQVAAYNQELGYLAHLGLELRPLSITELKKLGLDAVEIWDIDRALCHSDWAVYDYVRAGIEAVFVLRRCEEEEPRLKLHSERVASWLKWRIDGMLSALEQEPESAMFVDRVWVQLMHHDRMIDSLLRMKGRGILSDRDRQMLFDLQHRITALKQRPNAPPVDPVEANLPGEDIDMPDIDMPDIDMPDDQNKDHDEENDAARALMEEDDDVVLLESEEVDWMMGDLLMENARREFLEEEEQRIRQSDVGQEVGGTDDCDDHDEGDDGITGGATVLEN
jgi:hypothetical protein